MNLVPMRYKDYVWPHNPKIYEIKFERKIAVEKVPFGLYVMRNMGRSYRVLRGEGEFAGEGAYDEFKKLASVFYDEAPGILVHPVWQLSNAYFVSLSLKQEPVEDYVAYTFEFWESCDEYSGKASLMSVYESKKQPGQRAYHTVVSGDTMWAIARKNNMTLSELIALNPQIKNPNLIYPGNTVYLS